MGIVLPVGCVESIVTQQLAMVSELGWGLSGRGGDESDGAAIGLPPRYPRWQLEQRRGVLSLRDPQRHRVGLPQRQPRLPPRPQCSPVVAVSKTGPDGPPGERSAGRRASPERSDRAASRPARRERRQKHAGDRPQVIPFRTRSTTPDPSNSPRTSATNAHRNSPRTDSGARHNAPDPGRRGSTVVRTPQRPRR